MRLKFLLVVSVLLLLVAVPQTFAQNLVQNGSFETGDLTGWSGDQNGISVVSGAFYTYSGAQDGQYYAIFGAVGSDGTIQQTITTTPGAEYTFSFWLAAAGDSPSDFSVYWDGTQLLSLTNPDTGSQWVQYTYQVTGTGSDTLQFVGRDDPAWIALDNVSLTQNTQTTPEPGSLMLMGTGVLALGGIVSRKLSR